MTDTKVLTNARVLTMDGSDSEAGAVAIRNGRIIAVGTAEEAANVGGPNADIVDLGGRTVLPGFIDAHTHLETSAIAEHIWLNVRGFSVGESLDRIARHAEEISKGEWIVAQGTWGQDLPTRTDLDAAAPHHPVVIRGNIHVAVANSLALQQSGIDRRHSSPSGARVLRDSKGEPTGEVDEGFDLFAWPYPDPKELEAAVVRTARDLFLEYGVTSIYDVPSSAAGIRAYTVLERDGNLPVRLRLQLTVPPGNQPIAPVTYLEQIGIMSGFGNDMLSIGGMKIFADGYGVGAWDSERLDRSAEEWGLPTRTYEDLVADILQAARSGLRVWVHAAGDLAQEMALSALERATTTYPDAAGSMRIEHIGNIRIITDAQIDRMKRAGIAPVPNPTFLYAEPALEDDGKPGRFPMRTLIDAGFRPPGNSDTGGTQPFATNPWFGVHCMVTRANRDGEAVSPQEAMTVTEALRANTIDAAFSGGEERVKGSIETGKFADLIVLPEDPRSLPSSALANVHPDLVMVDGEFVAGKEMR